MESLVLYYTAFGCSSVISSYSYRVIKNKRLKYVFAVLLPVLISTLRYGIGTDYFSYSYYYGEVASGNISTDMEPLFTALNYLSFLVFNRYRGVLFLSSLLTCTLVYLSATAVLSGWRSGLSVWIFYCVYFSASLNVMRQIIALSFVIFALANLKKGKIAIFMILISIATFFHISAVVGFSFLFAYFLSRSKRGIYIYLALNGAASLIFALFGGRILSLLPEFIRTKYGKYFTNPLGRVVDFEFLVDILPSLLLVLIPAICYLFFIKGRDENSIFFLVSLLSVPVLMLGYSFSYFQRLIYYFDFANMFTFPIICKSMTKNRHVCLLFACVTLFFGFYFWYSSYYVGSNEIFPYSYVGILEVL